MNQYNFFTPVGVVFSLIEEYMLSLHRRASSKQTIIRSSAIDLKRDNMNRMISTTMNSRRTLAAALATILALGAISANAQTNDTTTQNLSMEVEAMAVIDVTGDPGALVISAPTAGGATPANATDNTTYARYTSVVETGTRAITAGLDVAAPAGTTLTLEAVPGTDGGAAVGVVTLNDATASDIITGIGNVATGEGDTDGAQLNYVLSVDDISQLSTGTTAAVVTLTLTDEA